MASQPLEFSSTAGVADGIAHLPCNLDAEQALLGAILFDNAAYERLTDRLEGRDFYEPFHQRLFAAMEEFIRKGQLAEPISRGPPSKRHRPRVPRGVGAGAGLACRQNAYPCLAFW